jgi:hypothetical protein
VRKVKVGGAAQVELAIRPLTIRQGRDINHETFDDVAQQRAAIIHAAAKRGGYQGTPDELEELLEGDDLIRCEDALDSMLPLSRKRVEEEAERARAAQPDPLMIATLIKALAEGQPAEAPSSEASGD